MSGCNEPYSAKQSLQPTNPLILQLYAETALYAVRLAKEKVCITVVDGLNGLVASCSICLNVSERNKPILHDDSCMVGRTFALVAQIAELRAMASPVRSIEYFAATSTVGEFLPARISTHAQAAQAAMAARA